MATDLENPLSIVILAAGKGVRMRSSLPKVLHPLGGWPLLKHVFGCAKALSPSQIIVVHGRPLQPLQEALPDADAVQWVEQPVPQGTADAVAKALPLIPPSHQVLVLYGDVPLIQPETLQRLREKVGKGRIGLLTTHLEMPLGFGRILRDPSGALLRVVEEKEATSSEKEIKEVNTGFLLTEKSLLEEAFPHLLPHGKEQEYYLTDLFAYCVAAKIAIVSLEVADPKEVSGVNTKAQLAELERYYQSQIAHRLMEEEGVHMRDPKRVDIRGTLSVGSEVSIDVNVVFEGRNRLGQGCSIGPCCVLINCEIGDGVQILAHSYLEGVSIGQHSVIGPFARLRPGSVLQERVRVGNFVEIKNTFVGEGSKINHLSYIGDTHMGQGVNVGAGTITCNYDGANKHQTIIEDEVHIGSDSQLVAPVRVGKGATIGAGSTICQDVPASQLTVTHRLTQRSRHWKRPDRQDVVPPSSESK